MNSREIAKLAGVSRSTVSRVINGYENVPEATRELVMKVIRENNYYPALSGQMLSGKKSQTLGLIWLGKDLANDMLVSSFFMRLVDAATDRKYPMLSLVLDNLSGAENIDTVKRIFVEGRIDAGIFIGVKGNEAVIQDLLKLEKIVGVFGFSSDKLTEKHDGLITVNFDREIGEKAVSYLYNLGHRKIGLVNGTLGRLTCVQKYQSFLSGMIEHSLPVNKDWIIDGGIVTETGYSAMKNFLSKGLALPTALFVNNDSCAFGVLMALQEAGIKVPEQISIVSCDGHPYGQIARPKLTTFDFDYKVMFSSLVNRVIDKVEEKENIESNEYIPSTFIEGETCAPFNL